MASYVPRVMPVRRQRCIARVCLYLAVLLSGTWPLAARAQVIGKPDDFNFASDTAPNATVRALVVQPDGKVFVAGDFSAIGATARGGIARFNPDGTLDTAFAASAGANGPVRAMSLQSDGKIIIGGEFTTFDGEPRNRIARLRLDGTLDATFNPGTGANDTVHAVALLGDAVIIGGEFTAVNDLARGRLALLASDGAVDPVFNAGAAGADGAVHAVASSASGALYVGGAFKHFNGSVRSRLAKVDSWNGALDPDFGANGAGPNAPVHALALQSNDFSPTTASVFVGGEFTHVADLAQARLALVRGDTGAANPAFTLAADGPVRAFAIQRLGESIELVVGGDFTQINSTSRPGVARLVSAGSPGDPSPAQWSLDPTFDPGTGPSGPVLCLGAESDGKTLLGGAFLTIDDRQRPRLARLYGTGGSVPPSAPGAPVVGPGTDQRLIVVWSASAYSSGTRIERSPDGVNDWVQVSTDPAPPYPFLDGPGLEAATGYSYRVRAYSTNGVGAPSPAVSAMTLPAPWSFAGAADAPFHAGVAGSVNSSVYASAIQPDGKILLGGSFTATVGQATRRNLVRLNPDGTPDASFITGSGPNNSVEAIAVQPDGRILIGGYFTSVDGVTRLRLARLSAGGSLDLAFVPASIPSFSLKSIVVQPDGRILIAGSFSTVRGLSRNGIARLHSNGSLDLSFDPGTGLSFSNGYTLGLQPDGKIVVGGFFQSVNGIARGNIARLHADGTLDDTFATSGTDGWIESLRVMPDGRIVIAGPFSTYAQVPRRGVARLKADGTLDPSFDPGTGVESGWAYAVAVQPDDGVILGGWFRVVRGVPRLRLARLRADGTLDDTFQPGLGANRDVRTLTLQRDGKIIAGGLFTKINDTAAPYVARLLGDGGNLPPAAPALLTGSALSDSAVSLAWNDVSYESAYIVERLDAGDWADVAATGPDVTTVSIGNLAPGMAHSFRVRARGTYGDSAPSPIALVTTRTAYAQWKLDHDLPADAPDDGDADADGLWNLLEYALDTDPRAATAADARPRALVDDTTLALTYLHARAEVLYTVESSTDLREWTADDVDQGGPGPGVVTATTPRGNAPAKFLRLRVER